ncbi:MAG: amidohydrolase [Woeseia sp.]|jgi:predicted amidohydrolase YtcJ|nr:amidohydrolase [Woeseia sp.]
MTPTKITRRRHLFFTLLFVLPMGACNGPATPDADADAIYRNARIYTVDAGNGWAESLAIRNGRIVAVGTDEETRRHQGTNTKIVDLQGQFLMPGIHDMHIHPSDGGIKELFECGFPSTLTLDEIVGVVANCSKNVEPGEWIRGGQWASSLLESDNSMNKELLDAVSPDNPVFLMDWSVHNAWVNSAALESLGITDETPNPIGGHILRDSVTGEATGLLLDNAAYEAQTQLPPYSERQYAEAVGSAIDQFVGFGITSFKDAMVTGSVLRAYDELARNGQLKSRVATSLAWKSSWSPSHEEELGSIANRQKFASVLVDTSFAKIMLDGVPMTRTSAMLDPYAPNEAFGSDHRGDMMFEQTELNEDVAYLDAQGLTVKIHATGDRAARAALDAFAYAREQNGNSNQVHELSHAQFIHKDDLPRFRQLNVAAEMCPILWHPHASDAARAAVLGTDRAIRMWPMRSLHDAGALVFYGSDWPAVVPDANPWPGIEAMVTRQHPWGEIPGSQWPEQAIPLETAIRVVTINGATAGKTANLTGSIEVGKAADFIVLDRNIMEIPIDEVSDVQVLTTIVNGEVVYKSVAAGFLFESD